MLYPFTTCCAMGSMSLNVFQHGLQCSEHLLLNLQQTFLVYTTVIILPFKSILLMDLLLVAPFWPKRPWFPLLLKLLVGIPRRLPPRGDLLCQPLSLVRHQNVTSLHLTLWQLSGSRRKRQDFLVEQRNSRQRPLESPLDSLTIQDSSISGSGATSSVVIPLLPL